MTDNETIPVLPLAIGQRVDTMQAKPVIPFQFEHVRDDSAIVIDQPVIVSYAGPRPFTLPPTRFVMVSQSAGVITGIDTSPQLRFSGLADANTLAIRLQAEIQATGWQLVKSYPATLDELQNMVADPSRTRRFEKDYAQFRAETVELRLYIKEAMTGGPDGQPPSKTDRFLVNVDVVDKDLRSKMNAEVFARRTKVNGSVDQSLPLSEWLKPR